MIACAPGLQPLWRYLLASQRDPDRQDDLDSNLQTWSDPALMVDAFVTGEVDAIGLIGATFLRLRERMDDTIDMFQPITWMAHGPVLCSREYGGSILDLKGSAIASPPLASDLMAYWKALIFHNEGYDIEDFFDLRPSPHPEQLLKEGSVSGAFVSGYAWAEMNQTTFSIVTNMRRERDRAVGRDRMPVMGGLVARRQWLEDNPVLVDSLRARLAEGLRSYQTNSAAFIKLIAQWHAIPSENVISTSEATYWCTYWGMSALSEDRLQMNTDDHDELIILRDMMLKAGCFDEFAN